MKRLLQSKRGDESTETGFVSVEAFLNIVAFIVLLFVLAVIAKFLWPPPDINMIGVGTVANSIEFGIKNYGKLNIGDVVTLTVPTRFDSNYFVNSFDRDKNQLCLIYFSASSLSLGLVPPYTNVKYKEIACRKINAGKIKSITDFRPISPDPVTNLQSQQIKITKDTTDENSFVVEIISLNVPPPKVRYQPSAPISEDPAYAIIS